MCLVSIQVTMSYFELYNEMIRDLLNPSSGLLDLREDNKGRNVVAGLSEVEAASTEDIMAMLVQGNKERTQEPTAANLTSSRYEFFFGIYQRLTVLRGKFIGDLSAIYQRLISYLSAIYRRFVSQLSAVNQPFIGHLSTIYR